MVRTLSEAFILVVVVVFLFLGSIRATIIPAVAVPVSLIGTFAALLARGYSANTVSLLAMVLAIGIVALHFQRGLGSISLNSSRPTFQAAGASYWRI